MESCHLTAGDSSVPNPSRAGLPGAVMTAPTFAFKDVVLTPVLLLKRSPSTNTGCAVWIPHITSGAGHPSDTECAEASLFVFLAVYASSQKTRRMHGSTLGREWCTQLYCNPWACLSTAAGSQTQLRLPLSQFPHYRSGRQQVVFFVCFFSHMVSRWWMTSSSSPPESKSTAGVTYPNTHRWTQTPLSRLPRPRATSHSFFTFDFSSKSLIINECSVNVAIIASSLGLDYLRHPAFTITATGKKVRVDRVCESNQSHVQSECVYTKVYVTVYALQSKKKHKKKKKSNILHFRKCLKDY